MTTSLRLPGVGAGCTTDVTAWKESWDALINPLEALGFQVIAFDPNLQLRAANVPYCQPFTLPIWAATLLINATKKNP